MLIFSQAEDGIRDIGVTGVQTCALPISFWPPSAILVAAFLLAPTQMWWVFLLAVLPAHLLVQLQDSTTLPTALGWYIANTCGPLLGAVCIRHSKEEKTLFGSLQGIIVFLMFGVLLPPAV